MDQGWNKGEPGFDGSFDFFEEWIEQDVTDMVRRDRNHPSIFLWSIGNEVDYPNDPYSHPILDGAQINQPMFGGYKPDAPDAMRIGVIAKRLAARVRAVDTSRPVTGALAGVVMSNETEYPDAVDVVGYNYTENRYDEDHATYPKRIITVVKMAQDLMPGMRLRIKSSSSDSLFGQVQTILANREHGLPEGSTPDCSILVASPSLADISVLHCGVRSRLLISALIPYKPDSRTPNALSYHPMHGTSGTMIPVRRYA